MLSSSTGETAEINVLSKTAQLQLLKKEIASQTGCQTINLLLISVTIIVSIIVRGNFNYPGGKIGLLQ